MKSHNLKIPKFAFLFCVLSLTIVCGCQNKALRRESRLMLGTIVEVVSSDNRAGTIAFSEIERIENLLSKYKENSEIYRLNKFGSLKVSPETLYIIKQAKRFWLLSGGAFDITVGPLMEIWGFRDKNFRLPSNLEIQETLKCVGFDKISIDEGRREVKFNSPGIKIDLGAIAKGYAVDCAVNKLRQAGVKNCLIDAGGQIYCLGNRNGRGWEIAIRNPHRSDYTDFLSLKDKAVATSGDYEQYFMAGGKRYAHIFDPKTGYPAEMGIASVTVIASEGLTADALATAVFVLGRAKGRELAGKFPGVEIKVSEKNDFPNLKG